MKNKSYIYIFTVAVFLTIISTVGCSKKIGPSSPGLNTATLTAIVTATVVNTPVTPVITATATTPISAGVKINAVIQLGNMNNIQFSGQYAASVSSSGTPVTNATVTISSVNGTKTLNPFVPGSYILQEITSPSFISAQDYTVTVSFNSNNYIAAGKSAGGLTLAADGSSASWTSEGNADYVNVIFPGMTTNQIFGPDIISPLDFNASGIYSHGSGSYIFQFAFDKTVTGAFSGATLDSTLQFQESHSLTRVK